MSKIGVLLHQQKTLGGGPEALRMGLADAGYADPPWSEVPKSRKAPKEVRSLLDAGIDRLLVWGGDGTVRRCIDTLVKEDADVELAILPAGTANLLAKALGIPVDLDAALDVALHGLPRRIDVGVLNGETFVVMAGTGFDALMIRDADDGAKERLGRISYVKAAARHLGTTGAEVDDPRRRPAVVRGTGGVRAGRQRRPDPRWHPRLPRCSARRRAARRRGRHGQRQRRLVACRDAGAARQHRLVAVRRHDQRRPRSRSVSIARCRGSSTAATSRGPRSFKVSVLPKRQAVCVPSS